MFRGDMKHDTKNKIRSNFIQATQGATSFQFNFFNWQNKTFIPDFKRKGITMSLVLPASGPVGL